MSAEKGVRGAIKPFSRRKKSLRRNSNRSNHMKFGNRKETIRIAHWNLGSAKLENKMDDIEVAIREVKQTLFGMR